MRRPSEFDLCRMSAFMSTEAVPNETKNDLRTYQIVYRTAWRETVTEWHHERHLRQLLRDDDSKLGLNTRMIGSPLPNAPTGMLPKQLTELNAERLYWRPLSLLGRCWSRMNITTDGHRVRATGCKGWSQIHQDWPTKLCTRGRECSNTPEYICGMNDHLLRSWRDRYKVIYDWPSPTAMILRAEATIHAEKSSPLHWCWLSANEYQSSVQSSNNDHWWAGPAKFTRNWDNLSASALGSIVSMTGYWDAYKLDIPLWWQWRWRWWAASGSHHRCRRVKTRLILWLEISPRLQCLIPTMIYTWYELRVRDWMVGCRTFRKWRYGGRCHLDVPSFSSLLFTCLLLHFVGSRPGTNGVNTGFYHLRRQVK